MGKYVTQNYLKKLGLEHLKSFATRGVIIDLVKVFQQAGKLKSNPACSTISAAAARCSSPATGYASPGRGPIC